MHAPRPSQYWCACHIEVTIEGPDGTRSVTTTTPFARVGADASADIVLPHGRLPRRALYLHATEEGVFWVNLTEPAGEDGPLRGWLEPEAGISLGPYRIYPHLGGNGHCPALPSLDLCAKGTIPEPQPSLVVAFDDQPVARRTLSRRLTLVGRRRPSSLRIGSNDLSAAHLILYWEAGTIWAIDLISRMGTKLDGEAIQASPFPAGSSLIAGEVKLQHGLQFANMPLALADSTPEVQLFVNEANASDLATSAIWSVQVQGATGGLSGIVSRLRSPGPSSDLLHQREIQDREREQGLHEQSELDADWKRRSTELTAKEVAFASRQKAWEAARKEQEQELARRADQLREQATERLECEAIRQRLESEAAALSHERASLAEERCSLKRRQAELDQRSAELERIQQRLEAERYAMEQERISFAAVRQAAKPRLDEEPSRQPPRVSETPTHAPAQLPQNSTDSTTKRKPRTEAIVVTRKYRPRDAGVSSDDPDVGYDEVMNRLFRVSRARRSWWSRLRSAFSRRDSDDPTPETTDTANSDSRSGETE